MISWGVPKRSSPPGTQLWAASARRSIPRPLGGGTLPQPPASGLRQADSVYTCHEGGGRRRKPERSPKLLHGGGREGARARRSGRWTPRGRAGHGGPGGQGWLSAAGMPSAVPRLRALPAAFRSRGAERSPRRSSQARSRADAGRCSRPGRLAGPGSAAAGERGGSTHLARPGRSRWAWLGGPGRNWLPGEGPVTRTLSWRGRKASCSRPRQRSGAMDAHPEFQRCCGTPIPLPSALFRRRRRLRLLLLLLRGDPRPLHTLSHHAAGSRCCRTSLPGAGG